MEKWRDSAHILTLYSLNQFSSSFDDLIKQYQTPQAICGYFALAEISLLSSCPTVLTRETLDQWMNSNLKNLPLMRERIEQVMASIQTSRSAYLQNHGEEFPTQEEHARYLRDWVANYEISDYLRAYPDPSLFFLRQTALGTDDADSMKHEELRRLPEEEPFRGISHFMEQSPYRFLPVDQWAAEMRAAAAGGGFPNCNIVADLAGHFVAMKPVYLMDPAQAAGGRPTMLVVNTTETDYSTRPVIGRVTGQLFGP
ncbi:hypothetical protein PAPYR_5354 [Paratrimastix pyriformis]|uniref:Uncharacterized protein n=1 Tax=Paratrimastix pyriformis TaxID=342808 RepID=A0ABQ8UHX2_9EUKA|nr:hypothetical protein PAPYR_5354 [Paratrimastix pyriformis]